MAAKPGVEQRTMRARDLALAAAICRLFGSIQKTRKLFTRPAWSAGNRPMAGKPGTVGGARPVATIIKISGSIPLIPMSFFSVRTRERLSQSTAESTWSSWYNQSTAQLYHVSADNAFPYRLYSGQQESGSVGIESRGDNGAITFRDWQPVAAEEYGYVVADPLDPNTIYGGKLTRFDRRTGQAQEILPVPLPTSDFRMLRTEPVVFSPIDSHLLFFAGNTLWKTRDRGDHWEKISPDLSRPKYELPASVGKYKSEAATQAKRRGVIYTVAPSPIEINRIWCGTDDGLIHLTTDAGKTWTNVTPPNISAWEKISLIDAGHFDANTAYAAVNTLRVDDLRPHIFRTHDSGRTWTETVNGIPAGETVNAVREDWQRKGLLFAGTEKGVYVSFDDGEKWESLRLNLPATSIRDLIIKNDDLVAATHGRGFWILDNITPLRQFTKNQRENFLFKPETALRVRWNLNTDTPLPPDEPAGENPPDGAMIDYFLSADAAGPVTLEIKDAKRRVGQALLERRRAGRT